MKKSKLQLGFVIGSLVWVVFWLFLIVGMSRHSGAAPQQVTQIRVDNPYRITLQAEIKCDWDWKQKKYKLHQWILIRKKSQTTITVPSGMRLCEFWPAIKWN